MAAKRFLRFEILESRHMLTAVDIPDDLTGAAGAQVVAPINIDDATNIRAAEVRLGYDPSLLNISESDITAGSVWAGDATVGVVSSVDDAAGTIVVSVFAAEGLPTISGSLIDFRFTIQTGAAVGASSVVDLTEVRLNERAIVLDTAPQPGPDATDGLITVTEDVETPPRDATISGTVYADVNNNNQPDATEGLPGVTITLVNTTTNEQLQATTQSDGRYEFTSLAAGSYQLQQRQPAAYLNGGVDELSVSLVASQSLTGRDFRELGLRPEFIYNRLFTTLVMPIGSANWVSAIAQINTDAEQGIVNPRIATTRSIPEAEGESPAATDLLNASPPAVATSIMAAEVEAPVADVTLESGVSISGATAAIETRAIIAAEGEDATELMVAALKFDNTNGLVAPAGHTVADPFSPFNSEVSIGGTSSTKPAEATPDARVAAAVDFVLSAAAVRLEAGEKAEDPENEHVCELPDELLALDEGFAATALATTWRKRLLLSPWSA